MAAKKTIQETPESIEATEELIISKVVDTTVETSQEDTDNSNSRTLRSSEDRESELRDMPWAPSRLLPNPNPRDDIDFRYVRVASHGTVDNMNHSAAIREGWEPVLAEECPELGMVISDVGSAGGNIVLGGMMLCKRDKRIGDQIRAQVARESRAQVEAVDGQYLRDQNSSMEKFSEKKTKVSFGK